MSTASLIFLTTLIERLFGLVWMLVLNRANLARSDRDASTEGGIERRGGKDLAPVKNGYGIVP